MYNINHPKFPCKICAKNVQDKDKAVHCDSGVTLLFEHSPCRASEIEHSEILRRPRENELARRFFEKFNLLVFCLIS